MRGSLLATAVAVAAACALSGCAGSVPTGKNHASRPYDPRNSVIGCIHGKGLDARRSGLAAIAVGAAAGGPRIVFAPTSGAAEADHVRPGAEGAEVIGDALLYVGSGSDSELGKLEDCLQ
jgi:hypothetical protein